MSRSAEDWKREKSKIMDARNHVREAAGFMDEYELWHTAREVSAVAKAEKALTEAEQALNELIGLNTVDWVENNE